MKDLLAVFKINPELFATSSMKLPFFTITGQPLFIASIIGIQRTLIIRAIN